jgi:hypothetical protein
VQAQQKTGVIHMAFAGLVVIMAGFAVAVGSLGLAVLGRSVGDQGVKAKLILESGVGPQIAPIMTDNQGQFAFSNVPPGKYSLKAKSTQALMNSFRTTEVEIAVPPSPQKFDPVTVNLK